MTALFVHFIFKKIYKMIIYLHLVGKSHYHRMMVYSGKYKNDCKNCDAKVKFAVSSVMALKVSKCGSDIRSNKKNIS